MLVALGRVDSQKASSRVVGCYFRKTLRSRPRPSKLGRRALENRDLFCSWYSSPLTPRSAGVEDEDDDEYENEASYENRIRQRG